MRYFYKTIIFGILVLIIIGCNVDKNQESTVSKSQIEQKDEPPTINIDKPAKKYDYKLVGKNGINHIIVTPYKDSTELWELARHVRKNSRIIQVTFYNSEIGNTLTDYLLSEKHIATYNYNINTNLEQITFNKNSN